MLVNLRELRPNNWYINREKLHRVRQAWAKGFENRLPPVLVSEIDGSLALIDGHSRAFAAYENGMVTIEAIVEKLEDIEGSIELYRFIHNSGPGLGVSTIADLVDRIVSPEEHWKLWISWCSNWLEDNQVTDKC